MIILDDEKYALKQLSAKFDECCEVLNIEKLTAREKELDTLQQDPDLFKDLKKAQQINMESKSVKNKLAMIDSIKGTIADLETMIELIELEDDESMVEELRSTLTMLTEKVDSVHLESLLKGEYDANNAIVTLQAGAGGTEAQDWTEMLYRMYRMYAEKNGFEVEENDYLAGDVAGIKSVTFTVRGINAYGYLKAEKGVHRLVRISPFNANGKRQTSFASAEVMPEIENDTSIEIRPEELKIDTYRSGGAGGQHVNKTDSAVRITHLPTGIVVQCQNERSQIQNREQAMKYLISKLVERREREILEKASEIKGDIKKIEWGSQIRSYVFQPYTMVKDHRTGYENSDVFAVMDGNIQGFIFDYLKKSC